MAIIGTSPPRAEANTPKRFRRVNRSMERHEENVLPAIPEGSGPIQTAKRWISDILNDVQLCWRRRDFQRNVMLVVEVLALDCDLATYTCTPGKDWLMAMTGLSRATVTRILNWLRARGFLGLVANGRQAKYTPRSSDMHARWPSSDGGPTADRAVYVLCQPLSPEERLEAFDKAVEQAHARGRVGRLINRLNFAVDRTEPPSRSSLKSAPKDKKAFAPLIQKDHFRRAAEYAAAMDGARTDLSWPRHRTTSAQDEAGARFNRLQAARTVRLHTPALASLSDRHLTAILTPFFKADWTAHDVIEAISWKLDGSRWPNDAAWGVKNVAAWLQHRLNNHRMNGMVVYSITQRQEIARKRRLGL